MATWEDLQRVLGREAAGEQPAPTLEGRWTFVWDMNADGIVTISDVWLCLGWAFFLPGDFLIYLIVSFLPSIGVFFELSANSYGGVLSGILSVVCWLTAAKEIWEWVEGIVSTWAARRERLRERKSFVQQSRLDPNAPRDEAEARLWAEQDRKFEEAKAARLSKLRPQ